MKWKLSIVVGVVLLALGAMAQTADLQQGNATKGTAPQAAARPAKDWIVPDTSVQRPEDAGLRAHTNIVFKSLDGSNKPTHAVTPEAAPDVTCCQQIVQTPASLGCIYLSTPKKLSTGCKPSVASGTGGPSAGGWGAIALVDAYDNPDAATDLATFDSYWGLATANFTKIEMTNSCTAPPPNGGWSIEESLDIEYAHVYAPDAAIVLVEACSSSDSDLFAAETEAFDYIAGEYGGGDVSNSWSGGEFSGEGAYNYYFTTWGNGLYGYQIYAFASAGDDGCGAAYPSSNPWLISSGGTSIYNLSNKKFDYEGCWSGSGGGVSAEITWAPATSTGSNQPVFNGNDTGPWANYQYPIFGEDVSVSGRATPDFALNSDPDSGVWIYNAYDLGGWSCCWGGTSEASPSLAAIVNRSANKLSTCYFNPVDSTCWFSAQENNLLYDQLPTATAYYTNFYDITSGSNGCTVSAGWDYCTGVGSPRGVLGK